MKTNLVFVRDIRDLEYQERVVEELKQRPKLPLNTQQAPSTLRNLSRDPSKDSEWRARPMPTKAECQVAGSAEAMEKLERRITPQEFNLVESTRRRPKNSTGQTEGSSASQERRDAAASAFTCSPPAILTPEERARITLLEPIAPPPPLPPLVDKNTSFKPRKWGRLTDGFGFWNYETWLKNRKAKDPK